MRMVVVRRSSGTIMHYIINLIIRIIIIIMIIMFRDVWGLALTVSGLRVIVSV